MPTVRQLPRHGLRARHVVLSRLAAASAASSEVPADAAGPATAAAVAAAAEEEEETPSPLALQTSLHVNLVLSDNRAQIADSDFISNSDTKSRDVTVAQQSDLHIYEQNYYFHGAARVMRELERDFGKRSFLGPINSLIITQSG